MICSCGSSQIVDVSTQDDSMAKFLCQECGKQGPASAFEVEVEEEFSLWDKFRLRFSEAMERMGNFFAP